VVRELLGAGNEVRVLLRRHSDPRNINGLAVETVYGDLTDQASLDKALAGCSALFHVAADYRLWTPNPNALYTTNVTGTRNILEAAAHAGVRRIVYTSSVATLGHNADGSPGDETTPVCLDDMIGHYKRSKFLAEAEVKRFVREHGLPVVIVNPSAPIGPRDIKPTPTGRMVLDAARGAMPAYVNTGLNLVDVDDVALGHRLAFERGRAGECYILGGENLTLKEIFNKIAAIAGQTPPRIRLPHSVLLPIAFFFETWAKYIAHGEPRVAVDAVKMSKRCMFYRTDKAKRELGFSPKPIEEGLTSAVKWFRDNGYV
jgi:dihydroflavonol-4-reductase